MTGIEPILIDGAAKAFGGIVIKTAWDKGGKMLNELLENLDENLKTLIYKASRQYIKNYTERHGILKVLGMREPVSLDSLYITVQIIAERDINNLATLDAVESNYRQNNQRRFRSEKKEKKPGIEVANQTQYLMVLGEPGAGKSTFLRKMGLEALKGNKGEYKHSCLPVFLELKRFTEPNIDIKSILINEFEICGFPNPDKIIENGLEQGKLLILFDGLDEVPKNNLTTVIKTVKDFVDQYSKNRFIISCRTAAYQSFPRFTDLTIAEFDDEQIEQFIRNWFNSEEDKNNKTADKCWGKLQHKDYEAAKELAHNPLLLTFLCLVYQRSQDLPKNRSRLYAKALRILLEEWAADKQIERDPIYEGLHTELEEILLSEIAYNSFEQDQLFFEKRDIVKQIKGFLAGNLNAPQHLNGEAVLKAIAIQQGILVERATDIYSFSHLTLQEYLTAQYIVDHNQINDLVSNHLTEKRWKEVFLLVAGLMNRGADELLLLMEKKAQQYLLTPTGFQRLAPILHWAEKITTGSSGTLKPSQKRAIAYAYVYAHAYVNVYANPYANSNTLDYANAYARFYALFYAHANAYANAYANAHANDLPYANVYAGSNPLDYANPYALYKFISVAKILQRDGIYHGVNFEALITQLEALKTRIPDEQESTEVKKEFRNQLVNTWLTAFHLNLELVNLSGKEVAEIDQQYFYIYWLMLQCKEAAVRVSPQVWEGIEDRMLRVV
ncbi:putative signal transduction protein with Nacht domain protein [Gloeothece citriformis PCC 7424]|uniref:Putative signal transduction protein with Nacht domain protein n=1 Tax=Gloeothece citriformis (strain PCC 7424) TaxID=65393 RepID=B7K932_GLOC7|nr:NACHT domain-containing protein [Gloeothece citriformis]ACK72801.1 putative signal transduction protein with Nacht domain protein [Gloeothece citriformis PCC 7424]